MNCLDYSPNLTNIHTLHIDPNPIKQTFIPWRFYAPAFTLYLYFGHFFWGVWCYLERCPLKVRSSQNKKIAQRNHYLMSPNANKFNSLAAHPKLFLAGVWALAVTKVIASPVMQWIPKRSVEVAPTPGPNRSQTPAILPYRLAIWRTHTQIRANSQPPFSI